MSYFCCQEWAKIFHIGKMFFLSNLNKLRVYYHSREGDHASAICRFDFGSNFSAIYCFLVFEINENDRETNCLLLTEDIVFAIFIR